MPFITFFLLFLLVWSGSIAQADQTVSATAQALDINAASAQQLAEKLPGIGPAKAARIVQWREENGAFKSVEQLQEVKGIGPKTLDKLRALIRVGNPAAAAAQRQMSDDIEESVRADVRRVIASVRLAATPSSIAKLPKRAWYKRSAMEILRTH